MEWHGIAWRGMEWHGLAWHGMEWRGIPSIAWSGVAWHGMAWHGVAWRGMAWRGMLGACSMATVTTAQRASKSVPVGRGSAWEGERCLLALSGTGPSGSELSGNGPKRE